MTRRAGLLPLVVAASLTLAACAARPPAPPPVAPPTSPPAVPPSAAIGPSTEIPDAIPRVEPRSRYGNPAFYEVQGRRYYVLSSSSDYVERGVASWYGPGFHQIRTSTGETYDMYAMTAAHKTLPLPAYARVTNLQNGRTCVVRINDRGPFVGNRLIDLSYSAAAKLDMLRNGTAMVEVRVLDPTLPVTPPPAAPGVSTAVATAPVPVAIPAALFLQAGAFADPANAQRLAERLRGGDYGNVFVRDDVVAGRKMFRVRIGPVPNVAEFDRIVAALDRAGVHDAHLAMD